jgi:hypothetical protein
MIEVVKDKEKWDGLLARVGFQDFYFSFDYHQLSSSAQEDPFLIHFSQGDSGILFPLLLRSIERTDYHDVTSVYGYAGPLIYGGLEGIQLTDFRDQLLQLFKDLKIVSAFTRLHPYIEYQNSVLHTLGESQKMGRVVNINLQLPLAEQWSHMSRRNRTYINKARQKYHIRQAKSMGDLEAFIRLYYQTMQRLEAHPKYFFEASYFQKLLKSPSFRTTILLAEDQNGKVLSGAMFISCGEIIQYHLSGTDGEFTKLHPVKLLIDAIRIDGTNQGYKYFNLGGGLGGSEDSLFNFKSRFSKDYRDFFIWKFVANPEVYRELSRVHLEHWHQGAPYLDETFFPSYRFHDKRSKGPGIHE